MSLSKVACESGEGTKRGAALYLQNHHQAGFSGRHRPLNVGGLKKKWRQNDDMRTHSDLYFLVVVGSIG